MPKGDFFIVMLLLWTSIGRGADGERVTGVLHGRVELQGRHGQSPDVDKVEWFKYSADNSTKKMIFWVIKPNNTICSDPCRNIDFNLQTRSLILGNLTLEDEGTYEEKITWKNNTITYFNFTLTLMYASNINVSCSPGSLILTCETIGEFKLLRWLKNGGPLPNDQRYSFTANNKTMNVSNLTTADCGTYTCQVSSDNQTSEVQVDISVFLSMVNNKSMKVSNPNCSDCGTYTCQVSNENGTELQVTVNDAILDVCVDNTCSPVYASSTLTLLLAGSSVVFLLVMLIIIIYICKRSSRRNIKPSSVGEPIYNDTEVQEETLYENSLVVVYQDFIRPKDSNQSNQEDDFGYATIPDVLEAIQLSQIT